MPGVSSYHASKGRSLWLPCVFSTILCMLVFGVVVVGGQRPVVSAEGRTGHALETTAGAEACRVLAGDVVPSPNVTDPTSFDLRGVSALSAGDIWAVGTCSGGPCSGFEVQHSMATLHWDGLRWSQVPTPGTIY